MKQIIKNFNNLVKRTIFNVQNKTNNKFIISNFNKYLITFITSLFLYLFYLLLPLLYDETWVQTNIENKLLNEFKINVSTSADISYRILPAPHFLIKDSKILVDESKKKRSIAEIKYFKVFLSQRNFFDKEKVHIKEIVINNANFSLLRNDFKLLNKLTNKNFLNKKVKINNSNIFFKDNLEEIISIIKVDKTTIFFDDKKLLNFLNLKGEVFNVPFTFDLNYNNDSIKYKKINFSSNSLKLNISNKSTTEKKLTSGENNISFLRSSINTKYNIKEKLITFNSANSKLNDSKISYDGELSINPFDLDIDIKLTNHKISKLFNANSILVEFFKSKLFFNNNISINTSVYINSDFKNEIFNNGKINFNIINGKINFDKTRLVNNKIGSLKLINSNLFIKNNKLFLNTDILFDIKNHDNLFSFFNINKESRKEIKNMLMNLDYDFLTNQVMFNSIKMDSLKFSDESLEIINIFNDFNYKNFHKSRLLVSKLFSLYEG
jgi:hypothetical protein